MNLLMTNSFTVVAKVFSNTLMFLLQKCEYKSYSNFFTAKNINVFAIFQDRNFKSYTFLKNRHIIIQEKFDDIWY